MMQLKLIRPNTQARKDLQLLTDLNNLLIPPNSPNPIKIIGGGIMTPGLSLFISFSIFIVY